MAGHLEGVVLKGKWTLGKFIASGACAEIYEVKFDENTVRRDRLDEELVACGLVAKVVKEPPMLSGAAKKKKRKPSQEEIVANALSWEHTIYSSLLQGSGAAVPELPLRDNYGEDASHGLRFLIMERLGSTLRECAERYPGNKLPLAPIADFGRQILCSLHTLHDQKLVFVDVKPENFMLSLRDVSSNRSDCNGVVCIADFGVAEKYITPQGRHREMAMGCESSGTPAFMSIAVHRDGATPSRRDDLEALGYMLVQFLLGALPWESASSDAEVMTMKLSGELEAKLKSDPAGKLLVDFLYLARGTEYDAKPDYSAFQDILRQLGVLGDNSGISGGKSKKQARNSSNIAIEGKGGSSAATSTTSRSMAVSQQAAQKKTDSKTRVPKSSSLLTSGQKSMKPAESGEVAKTASRRSRRGGKRANDVIEVETHTTSGRTSGKRINQQGMSRVGRNGRQVGDNVDDGDKFKKKKDEKKMKTEDDEDDVVMVQQQSPPKMADASATATCESTASYTFRRRKLKNYSESSSNARALQDASNQNKYAEDDEENDWETVTKSVTVSVTASAKFSSPIPRT